MILITHIILALSSVAFATYLLFKPSARKFTVSYSLIASTLVSGTYLVMLNPAHILQSCLTGLAYTSVVTAATVFAHRRLAKES